MSAWLLGLAAAALAHGPAPVALDVLAWAPAVPCDAVPEGYAPKIVRTNLGIHRMNEQGVYPFGCPARWGDDHVAMAAASPQGRELLVVGRGGAFVEEQGVVTALDLDAAEVPVAVFWYRGFGRVLTRNFSDGSASVFTRFPEGLERSDRWTDRFPDGVAADGDGPLLFAGAAPSPHLFWWEPPTERRGPLLRDEAYEVEGEVDRLTPRLVRGDRMWLVAGDGPARRVLAGEGGLEPQTPTAEVLHGPVEVGGYRFAVLDGVLWWDGLGDWEATLHEVRWTCLRQLDGRAWACGLDGLTAFVDYAGAPVTGPAFAWQQLAAPEHAECEGDWAHFGGEVGRLQDASVGCPVGDAGSVDGGADSACEGCQQGAGGAGGVGGLLGLMALWRRRR